MQAIPIVEYLHRESSYGFKSHSPLLIIDAFLGDRVTYGVEASFKGRKGEVYIEQLRHMAHCGSRSFVGGHGIVVGAFCKGDVAQV